MLTFDEVEVRLQDRIRAARVIAIDGLPLSGKSTLADRLASSFDLEVLGFDGFVLPRNMRPQGLGPGFPFPFFRVEEFRQVVRSVGRGESASYRAYDWRTGRIGRSPTLIAPRRGIIVEGCSTLDPELVHLFDLRLFVESDAASLMQARSARDGHSDEDNWRDLYLPSVALYMETRPQARADFIIGGRGL